MHSSLDDADLSPSADKRFIDDVIHHALAVGIDIPAICRAENIQNPGGYPGERVPLAVLSHMYDAVAHHVRDPAFIYRIIAQATGARHILLDMLRCCTHVGAALRLVCRYSAVVTEVCRFSLMETGNHFRVVVHPASGVYVSPIQIEAALHILAKLIQTLGGGAGLTHMHFFMRHAPRFERAQYGQYFGENLRFSCEETSLQISRQLHDAAIAGADGALNDYYAHTLDRYESSLLAQGELPQRVQRLFVQRMAFGEPDQQDIALCLNMSKRTMQRQLHDLGTTFRAITEEARLAVACEELTHSSLTINEIAFMLGYSDKRSFHRAFKRWVCMTPSAWRARARAGIR